MSGARSQGLAAEGPMEWMASALQARLQTIFPANYFTFAWMPAKADRAWFKKYVQRTPAVALGWNGITGQKDDGGRFTGTAHFTVALIVKNSSGPLQRYMGDGLSPGLFAMVRAATVLLHGWLIDPDFTTWCAQGTCIVNAAGNLYNEDWGDEDTAISALDLTVLYEEVLPDGLEPKIPTADLVDYITWNFGEQPPLLTQTVDTGAG